MCYERITYQNFSSIKPIPPKKGYRKIKKRTNYRYDALNRITSGTDDTGNYNLTSVAYDKNGNITNLERKGHLNTGATSFGVMDNLVYTYETNSNKLKKVLDNGSDTFGFKDVVNLTTEYVYDTNGNLVKDLNKGIGTSSVNGITYNHLNLPTEIKFDNSSTKKINYTYDATGVKLKKVVNDGGNLTTTDYANGYVYENNTLQFFNHPEGYVHNDNGTFKYVYNYLDHLGSIRLSYSDGDGNGSISQSEIIKENHYYPYGLKLRGFNTSVSSLGNSLAQKYMFNGKEFDDSFNETLNTYDFGARNYDPALGRWMNLDPLAEQMRRHSPYNYAFNNPIYWTDPDGMAPDDEWNKSADGTLTWISSKGGDTTDYVNNLDGDGNVTSTDTYDVETEVVGVSETSEMDLELDRSPGSKSIIAGRGKGLKDGNILTMLGEVADLVLTEVGEQLGVDPVVMAVVTVVVNPKKAIKKINPKKAAREAGRKKRALQKGSEKRAKDYGKDLAKREGKDAKRAAHDEKDLKDRTVEELKRDYKIK